MAGGGVARAQHRPLGRPLSCSPPGLAPLCPVLGTLHCHLPELLRAAPTLTLLSVTQRACLTAGDSSAPVHPLQHVRRGVDLEGGCKRLKSSRVPRAPGGREGSAKHVWGPDLRLLRQVRKRRGRLRVPAHHHLPPPTPQMPGASGRGLPGRRAEHSGVLVLWALWEDCPPHLAGRRCRPRPRDPPFPSPPGGQLRAARFYGRGREQGALLRPGATSSGMGSTASPASPPPSFTRCGLGMSSSGLGGPPTEDTLCFLSGMDQDKCGPGLGYGMNRKTRTDPPGPLWAGDELRLLP